MGIPLIREQQELNWAPDSLFLESSDDDTANSVNSDTSASKIVDVEQQSDAKANKEIAKTDPSETQTATQKETEKKSEIVAFNEPKAIKLEQAYSLFNKGILFIDARDESDFKAGHITNSVNIPFDYFDDHKQKLEQISKEKPIVIYCAGTECDLSHLLANLLFEQGYKQVYVFFGGWVEWIDANYPTEQSLDTN